MHWFELLTKMLVFVLCSVNKLHDKFINVCMIKHVLQNIELFEDLYVFTGFHDMYLSGMSG